MEQLKKKTDNQRKPDVKHLSDLRDALKAVVGNKPTTNSPRQGGASQQPTNSNSQPTTVKNLESSTKNLEPKSGPSPEELKKILDLS